MKELLKELILSKISEEDKTIGSIATFAIVRNASGIYSITIYWKGKIKKGDTSRLAIELDAIIDNAALALVLMEELIEEAKKITLEEKLKHQLLIKDDDRQYNKYKKRSYATEAKGIHITENRDIPTEGGWS